VLPAYHEADRIGGTVRRLQDELADVAADGGLEVVVVDDGSTDGTAEAALAAGETPRKPSQMRRGARRRVVK